MYKDCEKKKKKKEIIEKRLLYTKITFSLMKFQIINFCIITSNIMKFFFINGCWKLECLHEHCHFSTINRRGSIEIIFKKYFTKRRIFCICVFCKQEKREKKKREKKTRVSMNKFICVRYSGRDPKQYNFVYYIILFCPKKNKKKILRLLSASIK